ncbi:MAG: DUF748 domain-containing protein [Gammaproteobacteria bacterium]
MGVPMSDINHLAPRYPPNRLSLANGGLPVDARITNETMDYGTRWKHSSTDGPPHLATTSGEGRDPPSFPIEVSGIRFEGGTLDFADLSLILPFSTQIHALDGSIVGVSSAPKSRAELRLAGQIETYGEARLMTHREGQPRLPSPCIHRYQQSLK